MLAGGAAHRMGGRDKLALDLAGQTVLDRVLTAASPLCDPLVVVGPPRRTSVSAARFLQEEEPGGGPVPGVLAGVAAAGPAEVVLVLAGDLPMLTTTDLGRLLDALQEEQGADAVAALDERDRPNPLLAAYRAGSLHGALRRGCGRGSPATLLLPETTLSVAVGAHATLNVNRPSDLRRAEALLAPQNRQLSMTG